MRPTMGRISYAHILKFFADHRAIRLFLGW